MLSDPVVIGVVLAPHGVRGTVRVRPTGSGTHLRDGVEPVLAGTRRRIVGVRQTPKGFLVDMEGVNDRSEAMALRGEELLLDSSELDAPAEDEFYVADLLGLKAVNEEGEFLGLVEETFETRAHEVLVIRGPSDERYVPFTREHVPEVDLDANSIIVRPPQG